MSIKAINWALELELKPAHKLVLVVLAEYADDSGYSFPAAATIARRASVSRSTLFRILSDLEESGLLTREQRRLENGSATSNGYRINPTPPSQIDTTPRVSSDTTPVSAVTLTGEPPSEPSVTTTARARASQMPKGMTWSNAHSMKALARGVDVEVEFAKFTDYHLAKGSKFVDWDRAFHTWLNNARPEPGGFGRTNIPAPRTPTDRMNEVLAIRDPREMGSLE